LTGNEKMMNKKTGNKGAFSLEYAILLVILIAALVSISVYVKRGICGRFKQAGDTFGYGRQYPPR